MADDMKLTGLRQKVFMDRYAMKDDEGKAIEDSPTQMWDRIAKAVASVEQDEEKEKWEQAFRRVLDNFRFVPGGRILAGAGTGHSVTYYNCYVIPSPEDSREGIINTIGRMVEIASRGGGVGINWSTLRPRGAYVKGVNGTSSGPVSWMQAADAAGAQVQQGGCFAPDERIATDKGLIPAEELAERLEDGETIHALTHQGKRPLTWAFRNGVKPVMRVTTERGLTVDVTPEHKMGVLRNGELTTVPLQDLEEGDEILLLLGDGVDADRVVLAPPDYTPSKMSTTLNEDVAFPSELDEDLAYLLGYMYGDGHVHVGRKVNWSAPKAIKLATADAYPEIRERLSGLISRCFGLAPVIEDGDGACKSVSAYSRLLLEWLEQNGLLKEHSDNIRVPEAIFRSPTPVMGAFVAGYFDADGNDGGPKAGYRFNSVSSEMLQDVQELLLANGIVAHLHVQHREEEGWQDMYSLRVTGAEFRERMTAFMAASLKAEGVQGKRNHRNNYPSDIWWRMGIPGRYYQRLWDSTKPRISYRALTRIRERLESDGQVALAERVDEALSYLPDRIAAIQPVDIRETFDFEVEDVHMLAGGGIYTSNSRRCALMFMLDDWHPDVLEFITVKEDLSKIHNANLSVCVSDRFMEALEADADWELVFPDTSHPDYDDHWDGDINTWQAAGRPVEVFETVPAQLIWDQICESAWKSGEPGVVFMERYNKLSNSWYYARIVSTNPCVTGDTLIYTEDGLRRAEELFVDGTPVSVVGDSRLSKERYLKASPVFPTGRKPVYRLTTKEGYELRLTADHRVMTDRGWVEAKDLKDGDQIHILNRGGGFGQAGSHELGLALGWLVGDGTIKSDEAVLSFWHDDREIMPLMGKALDQITRDALNGRDYRHNGTVVAERHEARLESARLREIAAQYGLTDEKLRVPEVLFTAKEAAQRGFLQALFSGDGTVNAVPEGQRNSVSLSSVSLDLLQDVQRLLLNFGIYSRICQERKPAGTQLLPDGRGGEREYETQAYHDLVVSRQSTARFAEAVGFLQERKQAELEAALDGYVRGPYRDSFTATFTGLIPDGEELVYDLTEPSSHAFVANGLVVHNCGEQGLPAWGVCNLGALNLTRFVKDGEFQWDELREAVPVAVRFLDNVIDETPYHFEENAEQQIGERRVGLGTMGLADTLLKMGVTYGSEEGQELIEEIYSTIRDEAYRTSVELAREKGKFRFCEPEKLLQSGFSETLPDDIKEGIAEHGLRNVTLITQAPTGSTSLLAGVSSGIEPVFAYEYMRRDRIGTHMVVHPAAEEWLAEQGLQYDPEDENQNLLELLPDHFVTAADLTPEEHARVQAVIQKYTDSSISKTVNAPNDHTVDEVKTLYRLAYKWGCKGVTYFRDGCRDGVLTRTDSKDDKKEQAAAVRATNGEWGFIRPLDRPERLDGVTVGKSTPLGNLYVTVNALEGHPFEVFATIGRAGSDVGAFTEAIARLISLCFRCGIDPSEVADELTGIGGSRSVGFGPNRVRSVPDAIGQVIHEFLREGGGPGGGSAPTQSAQQFPSGSAGEENGGGGGGGTAAAATGSTATGAASASASAAATETEEAASMVLTLGNGAAAHTNGGGKKTMRFQLCPECGIHAMAFIEGCAKCVACGHSEC